MIIIPRAQACFIHIPRTGGIALQNAITRACPDAYWLGIGWEHASASSVQRMLPWASYRLFTVMRNPWEIVASYYRFLRVAVNDHPEWPAEYLDGLDLVASMTFPQLVQHIVRYPLLAFDGGFLTRYCDAEITVFQYDPEPWSAIAAWLGCDLHMERENGGLGDYPQWDQPSIDAVAWFCRGDVERFGYEAPVACSRLTPVEQLL